MKKTRAIAIGLVLVMLVFTLTACASKEAGNAKPQGVTLKATDTDAAVYDKGGIKITYLGMEKDNYQYILKFKYENTTDKEYEVQFYDDTLNGKEDIAVCSNTLTAQSTVEGTIVLPLANMEKAGLTEPEVLVGKLTVLFEITETVAQIPLTINFK